MLELVRPQPWAGYKQAASNACSQSGCMLLSHSQAAWLVFHLHLLGGNGHCGPLTARCAICQTLGAAGALLALLGVGCATLHNERDKVAAVFPTTTGWEASELVSKTASSNWVARLCRSAHAPGHSQCSCCRRERALWGQQRR